jgi:transposase
MIYAGIDVAKDKHDCFITNSKGEVLFKAFTIPNNRHGFYELYQKIESITDDLTNVKVGLEATGHYSYNILEYLLDKGLSTFVINPLHTNLYRKNLSLGIRPLLPIWKRSEPKESITMLPYHTQSRNLCE